MSMHDMARSRSDRVPGTTRLNGRWPRLGSVGERRGEECKAGRCFGRSRRTERFGLTVRFQLQADRHERTRLQTRGPARSPRVRHPRYTGPFRSSDREIMSGHRQAKQSIRGPDVGYRLGRGDAATLTPACPSEQSQHQQRTQQEDLPDCRRVPLQSPPDDVDQAFGRPGEGHPQLPPLALSTRAQLKAEKATVIAKIVVVTAE